MKPLLSFFFFLSLPSFSLCFPIALYFSFSLSLLFSPKKSSTMLLYSGFSLGPRGSSCPLASPSGLSRAVASDKSVAFCDGPDHKPCSTDPTQQWISLEFRRSHILRHFSIRRQSVSSSVWVCQLIFCSSVVLLGFSIDFRTSGKWVLQCISSSRRITNRIPVFQEIISNWQRFAALFSHDDFDAVSGIGFHDSVVDILSSESGWRSVSWQFSSTGTSIKVSSSFTLVDSWLTVE